MEPINKSSFPDPEPETVRMIEALEEEGERQKTRSTADKLRMMRDVEEKNDKNIREWSDEHEQSNSSPRGDQGEG